MMQPMKTRWLQLSVRVRMFAAMLSVLGAMWAAVDLHQHESGLHQSSQCVTCSLEQAAAHGFTLHAAAPAGSPWKLLLPEHQRAEYMIAVCPRALHIRAPPSLI
jgi:hypothetical protein